MAEQYAPFWRDDPFAWDNVYLGADICPGLCRIEGLESGRKVDIKTAPGLDGASLKDEGYEPAPFTIVCTLYQKQEFSEWQALCSRLLRQRGKEPEAFTCAHPQLALLGITACYVLKVSGLTMKAFEVWEGKISCIEFIPLRKKGTGTVKKALDFRDAETNPKQAIVRDVKNPQGTGALNKLPSKTVVP